MMGEHLINGEFQSVKYPTTPRGKVPLSCKDPTAQDLLWEYAQRHRSVNAQFSADLEQALHIAGYTPRDGNGRETSWLIERNDLDVKPLYYVEWPAGKHHWTPDPRAARKYATRGEALKETGGDPGLRVSKHIFGLQL